MACLFCMPKCLFLCSQIISHLFYGFWTLNHRYKGHPHFKIIGRVLFSPVILHSNVDPVEIHPNAVRYRCSSAPPLSSHRPPSPPRVIFSLLKLLYQKRVPQLVPFVRGSISEPDSSFSTGSLACSCSFMSPLFCLLSFTIFKNSF